MKNYVVFDSLLNTRHSLSTFLLFASLIKTDGIKATYEAESNCITQNPRGGAPLDAAHTTRTTPIPSIRCAPARLEHAASPNALRVHSCLALLSVGMSLTRANQGT